ncbi:hypothetical protein PF008_g2524 [Phytophthora fragariae]|uniref:RAVE complex protein Rav1 C-terminal domain-containing protein n=1 Tax=Phytophthora fragariae TaxID=53985 RepID=A0A6G0SGV0_9STRA|nr:hypothetical protein PF008_g2524 [Phytophthora fragariae]
MVFRLEESVAAVCAPSPGAHAALLVCQAVFESSRYLVYAAESLLVVLVEAPQPKSRFELWQVWNAQDAVRCVRFNPSKKAARGALALCIDEGRGVLLMPASATSSRAAAVAAASRGSALEDTTPSMDLIPRPDYVKAHLHLHLPRWAESVRWKCDDRLLNHLEWVESGDDLFLLGAGEKLSIWKLVDDSVQVYLQRTVTLSAGGGPELDAPLPCVTHFDVAPSGRFAATAGLHDRIVKLWTLGELSPHEGAPMSMFLPHSRALESMTWSKDVNVYNARATVASTAGACEMLFTLDRAGNISIWRENVAALRSFVLWKQIAAVDLCPSSLDGSVESCIRVFGLVNHYWGRETPKPMTSINEALLSESTVMDALCLFHYGYGSLDEARRNGLVSQRMDSVSQMNAKLLGDRSGAVADTHVGETFICGNAALEKTFAVHLLYGVLSNGDFCIFRAESIPFTGVSPRLSLILNVSDLREQLADAHVYNVSTSDYQDQASGAASFFIELLFQQKTAESYLQCARLKLQSETSPLHVAMVTPGGIHPVTKPVEDSAVDSWGSRRPSAMVVSAHDTLALSACYMDESEDSEELDELIAVTIPESVKIEWSNSSSFFSRSATESPTKDYSMVVGVHRGGRKLAVWVFSFELRISEAISSSVQLFRKTTIDIPEATLLSVASVPLLNMFEVTFASFDVDSQLTLWKFADLDELLEAPSVDSIAADPSLQSKSKLETDVFLKFFNEHKNSLSFMTAQETEVFLTIVAGMVKTVSWERDSSRQKDEAALRFHASLLWPIDPPVCDEPTQPITVDSDAPSQQQVNETSAPKPSRLAVAGLCSEQVAWGALSDFQSELLQECFPTSTMSWKEMRRLRVPFWLKSSTKLVQFAEKVAQAEYAANRDPFAVAVFYVLLGKTRLLASLFKMAHESRISELLSNNFADLRWKNAAIKNAYVLKTKQRYELSAAFFLLGGKVTEAVSVAEQADETLVLSFLIARISEKWELGGQEDSSSSSGVVDFSQASFTGLSTSLRGLGGGPGTNSGMPTRDESSEVKNVCVDFLGTTVWTKASERGDVYMCFLVKYFLGEKSAAIDALMTPPAAEMRNGLPSSSEEALNEIAAGDICVSCAPLRRSVTIATSVLGASSLQQDIPVLYQAVCLLELELDEFTAAVKTSRLHHPMPSRDLPTPLFAYCSYWGLVLTMAAGAMPAHLSKITGEAASTADLSKKLVEAWSSYSNRLAGFALKHLLCDLAGFFFSPFSVSHTPTSPGAAASANSPGSPRGSSSPLRSGAPGSPRGRFVDAPGSPPSPQNIDRGNRRQLLKCECERCPWLLLVELFTNKNELLLRLNAQLECCSEKIDAEVRWGRLPEPASRKAALTRSQKLLLSTVAENASTFSRATNLTDQLKRRMASAPTTTAAVHVQCVYRSETNIKAMCFNRAAGEDAEVSVCSSKGIFRASCMDYADGCRFQFKGMYAPPQTAFFSSDSTQPSPVKGRQTSDAMHSGGRQELSPSSARGNGPPSPLRNPAHLLASPSEPKSTSFKPTAVASHPFLPLFVSGNHKGRVHLWSYDRLSAICSFQTKDVVAPYPTSPSMLSGWRSIKALEFDSLGQQLGAVDAMGHLFLWKFSDLDRAPYYREIVCHDKGAKGLAFLNSSSSVATVGLSSEKRNVCVWDTLLPSSKALVAAPACHPAGATSVAFSSTHQLLVTGGAGGALSIFDMRQRRVLHTISNAHETPIKMLVLHPSGDCVLSGSAGGDVKIWSLPIFREVAFLSKVHVKPSFLGDAATNLLGDAASNVAINVTNSSWGVTDAVATKDAFFSSGTDGSVQRLRVPSLGTRL